MITIILAAIDAFSDVHFSALYLLTFMLDAFMIGGYFENK